MGIGALGVNPADLIRIGIIAAQLAKDTTRIHFTDSYECYLPVRPYGTERLELNQYAYPDGFRFWMAYNSERDILVIRVPQATN